MITKKRVKKRLWRYPFVRACWNLLKGRIRFRLILDVTTDYVKKSRRSKSCAYDFSLKKEEISREIIFSMGKKPLRFLDIGCGDGKLSYLLGLYDNVFDENRYDQNLKRFHSIYEYFGLDLVKKGPNMLTADICAPNFRDENIQYKGSFDVIYSNNVFEHLLDPWMAVQNIYFLLNVGGYCITAAPFSWRYHAVPDDYFRYSHRALPALFNRVGPIEVVISGYDLQSRRRNNQGIGDCCDIVPEDQFGAWRESWTTLTVVRKISEKQ